MTLPASPSPISMSNINTEVGAAANTPRDMAWVSANSKIAAKNLGAVRGFAWFQWTGNKTSTNCTNCSRCACTGGDARAWLQANCNCNCTGNCQCNCNCRC